MSAIDAAITKATAQIGQEVGVSNWILVDQDMIDDFAKTTQDDQWIHVDPVRAATETPFGGTIAHGFLTLSLASRFSYDYFGLLPGQVMGINYGFNKLRFCHQSKPDQGCVDGLCPRPSPNATQPKCCVKTS